MLLCFCGESLLIIEVQNDWFRLLQFWAAKRGRDLPQKHGSTERTDTLKTKNMSSKNKQLLPPFDCILKSMDSNALDY